MRVVGSCGPKKVVVVRQLVVGIVAKQHPAGRVALANPPWGLGRDMLTEGIAANQRRGDLFAGGRREQLQILALGSAQHIQFQASTHAVTQGLGDAIQIPHARCLDEDRIGHFVQLLDIQLVHRVTHIAVRSLSSRILHGIAGGQCAF